MSDEKKNAVRYAQRMLPHVQSMMEHYFVSVRFTAVFFHSFPECASETHVRVHFFGLLVYYHPYRSSLML